MHAPQGLDLEAMHAAAPLINELPGEPLPYYVANGEGIRREVDGQLYTIIARGSDTGGIFDAAWVLAPRGALTPWHRLPEHQRSYYVADGSVQVWLPEGTHVVTAGGSVHVPQGTPFAYRALSHMTKLLMFSADAGALDAILENGEATDAHVYPAKGGTGRLVLPAGVSAEELALPDDAIGGGLAPLADTREFDELPEGTEAYILNSGHGDNRAWPETINSYVARPRNTDRRYFMVDSLGGQQPYIIRHFHSLHTENFICLSGRIWIHANGQEVLLTEGDFLHAPAGTIHSFCMATHNTRMLGLLTGDIFEPFFDVTSQPANGDLVYTEGLIDPATIPAAMMAHPELDVTVVGPPPARERALGI
ncbi:MAG: cupin domain-containing protein [Galactobacter sp.]|uniref:cupin domain-containing protein n=1 Tax=Galactobacter sp. TaxID=2676125 RepID=UPI0025BA7872|nr:cupin domain-containing protein [Galactobacter sp.]